MGDIKKKKNKFRRPRKLFDRARIDEENRMVLEYGLKNKKEIWKIEAEVSKIRKQAKSLISHSDEERKPFFEKWKKMGLKVSCTADALALTKKDLLDRRLQTLVFKKNLARTPKEARQLIVHKKIKVGGQIVNIPSCSIDSASENQVSLVHVKGEKNG
jgi:small subunit ribosomal protein S4